MATIVVKQVGSPIRRPAKQRAVLIGLGLNKMHRTRELEDTPSIRGMVATVPPPRGDRRGAPLTGAPDVEPVEGPAPRPRWPGRFRVRPGGRVRGAGRMPDGERRHDRGGSGTGSPRSTPPPEIADPAAYERKLEETRAHLDPRSEVLEIGCGTGSTAIRHAPHAARILAVDLSPAMIDIARRQGRGRAGIRNVEFRVAASPMLDLPEGGFDMVMAHSVLHLLADPRGRHRLALAQWLRPGGLLVSSTACLGDPRWLPVRPVVAAMRAFGKAPRVTTFREATLIGWMESAGLTVETRWRPRGLAATFVVARAPGQGARLLGAAG